MSKVFDFGSWPEPEWPDFDFNARGKMQDAVTVLPLVADVRVGMAGIIERTMKAINALPAYPQEIACSGRAMAMIRKAYTVEPSESLVRVEGLPIYVEPLLTGAKYVVRYSDGSIRLGDLESKE